MKVTNSILALITTGLILGSCSSDDDAGTVIEEEKPKEEVVYNERPIDTNPDDWELIDNFSDEFSNGTLNSAKWENIIPSTSFVWTWETANVVTTDGNLNLNMTYEEHNDDRRTNVQSGNALNNIDMYYKSGIIRSKSTITYGYFEARIKGTKTYPGASPAFWLYSDGDYSTVTDGTRYSEVDIVEMQQGESHKGVRNSVSVIDCNLHAITATNNESQQWRPGTSPGFCKNQDEFDFDPSEDFHTYGVEVTETEITWYIDGKKVFYKANFNNIWNLPMHLTLSLGLRSPHVYYNNDGARFPSDKDATRTGFGPGEMQMQVDWVRTYTKKK